VFKRGVPRRIFGPKGEEAAEETEDYIMRNFITCAHRQILLWCSNQGARTGDMRNAYNILVGKPEGKE
jgi:hypothetical protein